MTRYARIIELARTSHFNDKPMKRLSMARPKLITPHGALYNADCVDLMRCLPAESIDCIFADPPFNIGKEYKNGLSDLLSNEHYLDWCRLWITESVRLLKPGAAIFIYNLPRWAYQLAAYLEEQQMDFRHWIAVSMKGTFPRGNKLYPAHYALLYFTKGAPKTFNRVRLPIPICRHCGKDIKDYGGHRKYLNPAGLNLTDFWEDTSPARHTKNKSRWHINELKPMIPDRCIQVSTNPGDIVLDPFGGGGSTYVSAEHLKRYWIGTEIGPCQPIVDRFGREFPGAEKQRAVPERLRPLLHESITAFAEWKRLRDVTGVNR